MSADYRNTEIRSVLNKSGFWGVSEDGSLRAMNSRMNVSKGKGDGEYSTIQLLSALGTVQLTWGQRTVIFIWERA